MNERMTDLSGNDKGTAGNSVKSSEETKNKTANIVRNSNDRTEKSNQQQTTPTFKSPSDTTIYAPVMHRALNTRQSGDEMSVFQQVSNFVDAMRLETEKMGNQARTTGQEGNKEMDHTPGLPEARKRTQQTVIEAEKFKAAIATPPTGKNNPVTPNILFNTDTFQGGNSFLHTDENPLMQPMQMGGELPQVLPQNAELNIPAGVLTNLAQPTTGPVPTYPIGEGGGLSDDDFFHLTCHIDPGLRVKIEKGEYVDLEKLLPKHKGKHNEETRLEWIHKDGGTFLVRAGSDRENKINGIQRWDQAFCVYATIYCGANPSKIP